MTPIAPIKSGVGTVEVDGDSWTLAEARKFRDRLYAAERMAALNLLAEEERKEAAR